MQTFNFWDFIMKLGTYLVQLGSTPIIGPLLLLGFVILLIKIVSAPPKKV